MDATTPRTGLELERVYREHGDRLWRAVMLATRSPELASDAVAEAFAQALRRGDEIREPLAWVWTTAFRIAAGELKGMNTHASLPSDIAESVPDTFEDLWSALGTLTPHQRTAVVLADYAGYPHRQIAEIMGTSTATVGVHVHRARKKLRQILEVDDDG